MTSALPRRLVGIGFVIGLITGVFGGLVGLGGGVLMIPLLTGWGKLTQHDAHATSLAAIIAAGVSGSVTYARAGALDWSAAILLGSVATIATYGAAHSSRRIHAMRLRRMFGVFLFLAAVLLVLKDELLTLRAPVGALEISLLLASGLLVGVTSGLLGVGGGALMVPLMVITMDMAQHVAQGTSLAAMVPAAVSGTAAHVRNRKVRFGVLLGLVPGISFGTWGGGTLALELPTSTLRLTLALVLALMSVHHLRERAPAGTAER